MAAAAPIEELVAATQARVLANFVGRIQKRRVLDVGTGTGRAALVLAHGGAIVTAVDPSPEMLAAARVRAAAESVHITFRAGDAHALDFRDRAFDVAVALRLLNELHDWRQGIAELCRVAGQLVIVDYPSSRARVLLRGSGNGAAARPTDRSVAEALATAGFRVRSVHRQFVLPRALHDLVGSRRFTQLAERLLERVGTTKVIGSPVTLVAERILITR
jgi:ubiquinone/menaquinone biosynthesis C-methylase UbiE